MVAIMDDIIEKAELAKLLGVSCRTIDSWVVREGLPYVRLPNRRAFRVAAVQGWIAGRERQHSIGRDDETRAS